MSLDERMRKIREGAKDRALNYLDKKIAQLERNYERKYGRPMPEPDPDDQIGVKALVRGVCAELQKGRLKEDPPLWTRFTWAYAGLAVYLAGKVMFGDMPDHNDDMAAVLLLPADAPSLALPSQHAALLNLLYGMEAFCLGVFSVASYYERRDWPNERGEYNGQR